MTNPTRKRVVTLDDLNVLNQNAAYARQKGEEASAAAQQADTARQNLEELGGDTQAAGQQATQAAQAATLAKNSATAAALQASQAAGDAVTAAELAEGAAGTANQAAGAATTAAQRVTDAVLDLTDIKVDLGQLQAGAAATLDAVRSSTQTVSLTASPNSYAGLPYGRLTLITPPLPAAVTDLTTTPTATGTHLAWTNNEANATSLAIYRQPAAGGPWQTLTTTLAIGTTAYDDVMADGAYTYAVAVRRGLVESTWTMAPRALYLPPGAVYFDFTEGAGLVVADRSGQISVAAAGSGLSWTAQGFRFSGTQGYLPMPAALGLGSQGLYVMALVHEIPNNAPATQGLYSQWGANSTSADSRYYLGAANGAIFGTAKPAGGANTSTASTAAAGLVIGDNAPHIMEFQLTATDLKAWVDGNHLRSVALTGLPAVAGAAAPRVGLTGGGANGMICTLAGLVVVPLTDALLTLSPAYRNNLAQQQIARVQQQRGTTYPWGGAA